MLHTRLVAVLGVIRSVVLIVLSRLIEMESGQEVPARTRVMEEVECWAVEVVLAAEHAIGRNPVEVPRNNPGYDIRSADDEGRIHYIEVKGRIEGVGTFAITTNEVASAQTQGERHRLALIQVSLGGPEHDELHYVTDAFAHLESSTTIRSYNGEWCDYWNGGGPP